MFSQWFNYFISTYLRLIIFWNLYSSDTRKKGVRKQRPELRNLKNRYLLYLMFSKRMSKIRFVIMVKGILLCWYICFAPHSWFIHLTTTVSRWLQTLTSWLINLMHSKLPLKAFIFISCISTCFSCAILWHSSKFTLFFSYVVTLFYRIHIWRYNFCFKCKIVNLLLVCESSGCCSWRRCFFGS